MNPKPTTVIVATRTRTQLCVGACLGIPDEALERAQRGGPLVLVSARQFAHMHARLTEKEGQAGTGHGVLTRLATIVGLLVTAGAQLDVGALVAAVAALKNRTVQLEQENRRLRAKLDKGGAGRLWTNKELAQLCVCRHDRGSHASGGRECGASEQCQCPEFEAMKVYLTPGPETEWATAQERAQSSHLDPCTCGHVNVLHSMVARPGCTAPGCSCKTFAPAMTGADAERCTCTHWRGFHSRGPGSRCLECNCPCSAFVAMGREGGHG